MIAVKVQEASTVVLSAYPQCTNPHDAAVISFDHTQRAIRYLGMFHSTGEYQPNLAQILMCYEAIFLQKIQCRWQNRYKSVLKMASQNSHNLL